MKEPRFAHLLPLLAVLGSVTALGIGTSYAKHLFPLIGAQGTIALRVGFSALLLLALWRPWRWPLGGADRRAVVLYGVSLGLMNLLFYMSLRTIPFGLAVAIEFTGPLAVAIWSSRKRTEFVWLALAITGLALILPIGSGAGTVSVSGSAQQLDPAGVAYALAAAVCWGAYIVFGKRLSHLHAGHSVALGLTVGAMTVFPVGVWHAGASLLDPGILLYGLGVAAVSSAIPISLEMMALKRLPQGSFGIMTSTEPAVAAILGMWLLNEHLSGLQWLAIVCIMGAAAGSALTGQNRDDHDEASNVLM